MYCQISETPLEIAYGREMNIQFLNNSSGGHSFLCCTLKTRTITAENFPVKKKVQKKTSLIILVWMLCCRKAFLLVLTLYCICYDA